MPRRLRLDIEDERLRALIERLSDSGERGPSVHEQVGIINRVREEMPEAAPTIDRWLLYEINNLRQGMLETRAHVEELKKLHEKLTSAPWYTAVFLRLITSDGDEVPKAIVSYLGAPRVVTLVDAVNLDSLSVGEDVLLSSDLNLLIRRVVPSVTRACEVAEFQQTLGAGRILLKSREAEVAVHTAGNLDSDALQSGDRVRWDPTLGMAFERLPRPSGTQMFLAERPTESFADIGGLDRQVELLQRRVRLQRRHPSLVARYRLKPLKSVLLVGPPGTGKTLMARAFARSLGDESPSGQAKFIHIKPGALHSQWFSASEAAYRELFRVARAAGAEDPDVPVVLFFDEVDSIGMTRTEGLARVDDRVLTSFMAELDGFDARGNVLVIAATNRLDALDPALLRPGRLGDLVLEIPRPSMAAARAILERHLPEDVPYHETEEGIDGRRDVIDTAVSRLYAPNGEGEVASITFRDGTERPIMARDLVSGAVLANIARVATERACVRELESGAVGLRPADVMEAVADEIASAVSALTPVNCRAHLTGLPQDLTVARVTPTVRRTKPMHRFINAA